MAEKTFRLEVVAPDAALFSGEATFVRAQTTVGQIGVMANHEPVLAELAPGGCLVADVEGGRRAFAVQGGFMSVSATDVIVLAENAQDASEIDAAAARAALESAAEGSDDYQTARSQVRAIEAVS